MLEWLHRRKESGNVLRTAPGGTGACWGGTCAQRMESAAQEIAQAGGAERVGIWLKDSAIGKLHGELQGRVWEDGLPDTPPEWRRMASEVALPAEVLIRGEVVENSGEEVLRRAIVGPLMELRHYAWVPILGKRGTRGVILLGSRKERGALPVGAAQKRAAELATGAELEELCVQAEVQQADLTLTEVAQWFLLEERPADEILEFLAENCTLAEEEMGLGAEFAVIAQLEEKEAAGGHGDRWKVRAQSGGQKYAGGWNGEARRCWRQAVEEGGVVCRELAHGAKEGGLLRMLVLPLGHGSKVRGVLAAGLAAERCVSAAQLRLALRARFAAETLQHERAEKQQKRRENWQRGLLEHSGEALAVVDGTGRVVEQSCGLRELLASGGQEETGNEFAQRFVEMFRPGEWDRMEEWLKRSRRRDSVPVSELTWELRDGRSVTIRKLEFSSEELLAVQCEATEKEGTAKERERGLGEALEWVEEGILVVGRDGAIQSMNGRLREILGVSEKEGRGLRSAEDLLQAIVKNAANPEAFEAGWRAAEQDGQDLVQEFEWKWPVPQVVQRMTRRVVDEQGKPIGRVEVYRDTTARRLFQERMVQSDKLAALGQRLTGIVHDLSNPLTSILGNAQRLLLRGRAPQADGLVRRIVEDSERAAGILRQLLAISRNGRGEWRTMRVDDLVEKTVELHRSMYAGNLVEFRVEAQGDGAEVHGDFAQLQQALLNLLQNAQQAIEQSGKGGAVGVRTERRGDRVRIEVWDDGPGVPEAIQSRIFDPFFTTKAPGMGTGLGLPIVLSFLKQHGGAVRLATGVRDGACFVMELPTTVPGESREPVRQERRTRRTALVNTVAPRNGSEQVRKQEEGRARVLVLEDEPTVATLIADVLGDEGMKVDIALDSATAVRLVEKREYDLLICDVKMPGMDGAMFYGRLKKQGHPLHQRVLFVTGDVLGPRSQEFLEENHVPHVAKPFRVEELLEAVKAQLGFAGVEMPPEPIAKSGGKRV